MDNTARGKYLRRKAANRARLLLPDREQWPNEPYAPPTGRVDVPYLRPVRDAEAKR